MTRFLPLLALALALSASGCDSGGPGNGSANCATGSLTATAGGTAFTASCVQFTFQNGVLAVAGITNLSGGAGATQRQINLTIPGAAVGTVSLGFGNQAQGIYVNATSTDPATIQQNTFSSMFPGGTGQIVIEEVSATRARGTFSFTGANQAGQTAQITGGSFDVRP